VRSPTRKQIAARCQKVQATWSESERLRRLRCDLRPEWSVPVVRVAELLAVLGGEDS
jgi:hypothetical protein